MSAFFPFPMGTGGQSPNQPGQFKRRSVTIALFALLLSVGTAFYMMYKASPPLISAPASCRPPDVVPAAETAVVVHSYTGRTAAAGREIASMLGGSFHEFNDPPPPDEPETVVPASRLTELSRQIRLKNTHTIFFGFPIWGEGPTRLASDFINSTDIAGKKVVLFYTYLHLADGELVKKLTEKIKNRGAECPEPVAIRLSASDREDSIVKKTRQAILARRDLWTGAAADGEFRKKCEKPADRPGPPVCTVPAGKAWVSRPRGGGLVADGSEMVLSQVSEFKIDRTEVTVADYRRCEKAGACTPVDLEKGYCAKFVEGDAGLPMPCASPADAKKYCTWVGRRLPTLEEWSRAARGGTTRAFPWGDEFSFSGKLGNFGEKPSTGLAGYSLVPENAPFMTDGFKGLAPGCSFPAGESPFGLCDMAGNLAEIVTSRDKTGGETDNLVGGSWLDTEPGAFGIDSAVRWRDDLGSYFIGFRCAI